MPSGYWTWGSNYNGQLGDGTTVDRESPVHIAELNNSTSLCAQHDWACALKADGTIWTWGRNMFGQLGIGGTDDRPTPARISNISGVAKIAADMSTGYAIKSDGTVWTWGSNPIVPYVGLGPDIYNFVPRKIEGFSEVVALSVQSNVVFAVRSDGSVWAWGNEATWGPGENGFWQFGLGELAGTLQVPTRVPGLNDVVQIIQEEKTAYALKSDGTVFVWGKSGFGRWTPWLRQDSEAHSDLRPWSGASAGTLPIPTQAVPTEIEGLTDVQALATMWTHDKRDRRNYSSSVFALKSDGTVSTWGSNDYGQLGDGSDEDRWSPAEVVGLTDATSIVVVYQSVFALKADGTVWAWGGNDGGRLGVGNTIDQHAPAQVLGLHDIRSIHPCRKKNGGLLAVRSDGSLWVAGSIGDVGLTDESAGLRVGAARVRGLSEVTKIIGDALRVRVG